MKSRQSVRFTLDARLGRLIRRRGVKGLLALALVLTPAGVSAQRPHPSKPPKPRAVIANADSPPATVALKGVWESVGYPADVEFTDVYFVTPDIGWVSGLSRSAAGEGGVILHTKDGGTTWTPQLGDPESATRGFRAMQFIDGSHGWVAQYDGKLLRTTDGETWETVGDWSYGKPYRFISPRVGFGLDGSTIKQTTDAGRTWNPVFQCQVKIQVDGLTQSGVCWLQDVQFPSPQIGFAVSSELPNHASAIVKTEDGGTTWKVSSFLPDASAKEGAIHFFDQNNGMVRTYSKVFITSDGGQTWRGVPASVPEGSPAVIFADPQVGWMIERKLFTYTKDGGKTWNSRETAFPASVNAFSIPRRDRGYVVGDHGMIYRYRLVAATEATSPKALAAPAMPSFDSPIDGQVNELDAVVQQLEASVAAAPDTGGGTPSTEMATGDTSGTGQAAATDTAAAPPASASGTSDASAFTAACCGKPLSRFQLILTAVTGTLPQFLASHKNTNLLLAGLRMLTDLPGRVNDLRSALRAFRKASDKAGAQEALARVSAAVKELNQSTAVAFQRQVPPAAPDAEEQNGSGGDTTVAAPTSAAPSATPPDDGVAAEAASAAEKAGKQKAKESLGKSIKNKMRF